MTFYLILLTFISSMHEFHVSRTEIEYDQSRKRFEVSVHVFSDDVLSSIGIEDLLNQDSLPQENIMAYILDHFEISTGDGSITLNKVGLEETDDFAGVWCYFESDEIDFSSKEITISNDILVNDFDDQNNLINIKLPNQKSKYFILNSSSTDKVILLK